MPIFIPLILIGTTVASVVATATIPQSINEPTKQILKEEIQQEITISQPKQETNFSLIILIVIVALIIGAVI